MFGITVFQFSYWEFEFTCACRNCYQKLKATGRFMKRYCFCQGLYSPTSQPFLNPPHSCWRENWISWLIPTKSEYKISISFHWYCRIGLWSWYFLKVAGPCLMPNFILELWYGRGVGMHCFMQWMFCKEEYIIESAWIKTQFHMWKSRALPEALLYCLPQT